MTEVYKVGQAVELNDSRTGIVQFVGQTSFSSGDWIGVVLEDASGKNDGSVQGQRYFDCDPGHGMFLRSSGISKVLREPAAKPAAKPRASTVTATEKAKASTAAPASKPRPSSIVSNGLRKSVVTDPAASKRQSMNAASPTPAARTANGVKSPAKPGVRTTAATSSTSARGATPSLASKRTSTSAATAPKPTTAPRSNLSSSTTARRGTTSAAAPGHTSRPSLSASTTARTGRPATTTTSSVRPSATQPAKPTRQTATTTARPTIGNSRTQAAATTEKSAEGQEEQEQHEGREDLEGTSEPELPEEQDDGPDPAASGDFAPRQPKPKELPEEDREAEEPRSPPIATDPRPVQRGAVTTRHIQDLETKLRMLEKRREEDKEKLLALEKMQTEKERLETIIQKMQNKLQPQSQELTDLRKQLKEAQARAEENQSSQADHETSLEEAYLDREMAEELAEAAKTELEAVKQRLEELQLEVEVLREENQELGTDMSPEERSSQGWLQMERSNERLREALLRLRDITQDTEAELREEIGNLEEDLKQLGGMKDQYEDAKEKLKVSEAAVESLKEQLDDALGSEQTIEEFAAQNESLKEQMDELKITIQDLEDLKDLNDELEINHVEAEKQMQDELDFKDSIISDHRRQATDQQEKLIDYEYTITKFRELTTNLQSHLEDMKASQQLSEAETEELSSRSKAMTDLNLKLQSSAARTQMNAIDLETRRLDAQEAIEHLAIVQMFLPESYQSEKNSVLAYLRFIRLAAKSRILHQALRSKIANDSTSVVMDDVFAVCDILDKLVWIASMCDRFVSRIAGSPLEEFSRYEAALHELDPVERGLNGYIEAAKKDDLRASAVAEELQRTEALLTHLAEVHIHGDSLADYAEDVLMRTALMQTYLENTATALSSANTIAAPNGTQDLDEDDSIAVFVSNCNGIIAQSRSAKVVAGKALQALQDLKSRSMSTGTDNLEAFEECQQACANLAGLARQLGQHLRSAAAEEQSEDNPLSSVVRSALGTFCGKYIPNTTSTDPLTVFATRLKSIASQLGHIHDVSTTLPNTVEFSRMEPPWAQRAAQLKNSKLTSQTAEAELTRLKDTLSAQGQQLRARDQSIEEATVKIELLESRTKDANAKANRITELSRAVESGKARERELALAIEAHARDVAALQAERDRWRQLADERKNATGRPSDSKADADEPERGEKTVATAREIDALNAEIAGLQSAVRFLRSDNQRARLALPGTDRMTWLQEPLLQHRAAAAKPAAQERARAARDGRDALSRLAQLGLSARVVDLAPLAGGEGKEHDRLRWRPAREKSAWVLARQLEEWQAWRAKSGAVVQRGNDVLRQRAPPPDAVKPRDEEEHHGMNGHAPGGGAGAAADAPKTNGIHEIIHEAGEGAPEEKLQAVGVAT